MACFLVVDMKWYERRPLCNNNADSAPCINGHVFLLCWRCTGGVVGATIALSLFVFLNFNLPFAPAILSWLLILPACADYWLKKKRVIKPSNVRRFLTGLLLGIPFSCFAYTCFF